MMLSLKVESLAELRQSLSAKGQHCYGAVFSDDVGKWAVQLYPNGDTQARDGYVSIFLKNLVLAKGVAAVKIEGNIRVVEGASLRVTKAFGKSSAYLNPNADGMATSSSWGFHDYSLITELPDSFLIEAEILVKEVARDDTLSLHVASLAELKKQYPRGQSTLGFVYVDPEGGKWSLCLYPNGDNLSTEGQLGVFVKVLALPRGVMAVKIEGNLRVLQQGGQILTARSFPVSTFLNASGTGAASSSTWGFHCFMEAREVQDSFIIEADITIRERVNEPNFEEVPEEWDVERLLSCLRSAHLREVDEARNSRRMLTEAQLRTLTLDQLLEMQENISAIIKEKRSRDIECSVCQDRVKSMACVPCGHRFCVECSAKINTCPECRQPVTQKIKVF